MKEQHFTQQLIEVFNEYGQQKVVKKNEILLFEGDIERYVYLVEKGAIRVVFANQDDEQTIRFGYKGSIINSLASFLNETPSAFFIEAIRASTVRVISKEVLMKFVYLHPNNQLGYIQLLEGSITQQIDREVDLLITSPSIRYQRVLERSPALFQEVPLKYIASYLRMKPETLSRIRKS